MNDTDSRERAGRRMAAETNHVFAEDVQPRKYRGGGVPMGIGAGDADTEDGMDCDRDASHTLRERRKTEGSRMAKPTTWRFDALRIGMAVFFAALFIYGVAYCFQKSSLVLDYGNVAKTCRTIMNVTLIMAAVKIVFFSEYETGEKVMLFVAVTAAIMSYILSGFMDLVDLTVFLAASKGVRFRDTCLCALASWGGATLVIVVLAQVGVMGPGATAIEQGMGLVRHSFGYKRWNDFGAAILLLYMAYFYLRFERFGVVDGIAGMLLAYFLFFVVAARAAAFAVLVLLVFCLVAKVLKDHLTVLFVALFAVIVASIALTFALPMFYGYHSYDYPWLVRLNLLLSSRLVYCYGVMVSNPVSLFGQFVNYTDTLVGWTYMDSSLVWLLYNEGVLSFTVIVMLYMLLFYCAYRNGHASLMVLVTVMVMLGFGELTMVRVGRSIVLLALLPELYEFLHSGISGKGFTRKRLAAEPQESGIETPNER